MNHEQLREQIRSIPNPFHRTRDPEAWGGFNEGKACAASKVVAEVAKQQPLRLYLFDTGGRLYMAFGVDCRAAAQVLGEKLSLDWQTFSVGGSYDIDPKRPITISDLWPYFTNRPGRHASE